MRLDRLTPAHVRRAMRIYLDLAFPPGSASRPRIRVEDFEDCATLEELFARFESPPEGEGPTAERYALRLGNARYPFMKFVVWEYLVHSEFFFSVDTHDDLAISSDMPDYEGWLELRRQNRELKERIETAWSKAALPTHEDLRGLMEDIAQLERSEARSERILLVDDAVDVAHGVAAILRARGYEVETAFDGREALERLETGSRPDLMVLDYSMPELDGQEVLRRLRADPRWQDIPVLLATARAFELGHLVHATGYLLKPYPREVLLKMIGELLASTRVTRAAHAGEDGAPPPGE